MTHSIPDACAVALTTELGTVLITGDYKFDQTPVDGPPADIAAPRRAGHARACCCCAATRRTPTAPGCSPSESVVGPEPRASLQPLRGPHRRHELRLEHPPRPAGRRRRGARSAARSRWSAARCARTSTSAARSGHIEVPEGMLVQPREIDDFPDEKLVIISTGSQGEPLSALRRMAHRDHPQVELHEGDTVVFSATPIPGNERAVNETIDRLYHIGCDVHHDPRRADPRLRPRLRRGAQADAQPRSSRAT